METEEEYEYDEEGEEEGEGEGEGEEGGGGDGGDPEAVEEAEAAATAAAKEAAKTTAAAARAVFLAAVLGATLVVFDVEDSHSIGEGGALLSLGATVIDADERRRLDANGEPATFYSLIRPQRGSHWRADDPNSG